MSEPQAIYTTANTTTDPEPQGYVNCDCGAILGYKAKYGKAIFLHTFAYPPSSVNHKLEGRRINARLLAGDVVCPYCGRWTCWNGAELPRRVIELQA